MSEDTSRALWFLAGGAIGAAVALLYAPQPGAETRKQILEEAGRGRESLTGSGHEAFDRGREFFEKGRQIADEAADIFERGRKLVRGEEKE